MMRMQVPWIVTVFLPIVLSTNPLCVGFCAKNVFLFRIVQEPDGNQRGFLRLNWNQEFNYSDIKILKLQEGAGKDPSGGFGDV